MARSAIDRKTLEETQGAFKQLLGAIDAGKMVFFGGAGVSTESGIPDFRSAGGVFSKVKGLTPEIMLSREYASTHQDEFFNFYFSHMIFKDALPNPAHRKLAELEQLGILGTVITQNVDGLHQAAGNSNVIELHGSVHRNHCENCKKFYDLDHMLKLHDTSKDNVPRCDECGSVVWPDVVLYGDSLDQDQLEKAALSIKEAEMLVIAGTSLQVYPAAALIRLFAGDYLVIVSLEDDPGLEWVDLYVQAPIGKFLSF